MAEDELGEAFKASVVMRMMAAMLKRAGGELIVTEQDLVDTTFERLAFERLPDGSGRLYLRPDLSPIGKPQ